MVRRGLVRRDQILGGPRSDSGRLVGVQRRRTNRAEQVQPGWRLGQHRQRRRGPVAGTQLAEDGLDVGLDGVLADEQVAPFCRLDCPWGARPDVGLAGVNRISGANGSWRPARPRARPDGLRVDDGPAVARAARIAQPSRVGDVDHEVAADTRRDRLVHDGRVGRGQRDIATRGKRRRRSRQALRGVHGATHERSTTRRRRGGPTRPASQELAFARPTDCMPAVSLIMLDQTATEDGGASARRTRQDPQKVLTIGADTTDSVSTPVNLQCLHRKGETVAWNTFPGIFLC